jgi:hypothetical protein
VQGKASCSNECIRQAPSTIVGWRTGRDAADDLDVAAGKSFCSVTFNYHSRCSNRATSHQLRALEHLLWQGREQSIKLESD